MSFTEVNDFAETRKEGYFCNLPFCHLNFVLDNSASLFSRRGLSRCERPKHQSTVLDRAARMHDSRVSCDRPCIE